jgi:hypothetical protein
MKYSFKIFAVVFLTALFIIGFIAVDSAKAQEEEKSCFYNSLHRTGEGMRYWYEEQGGFKAVTGIPYKNLDCKNCHVKSCDRCHVEKKGEKCLYSLKKAKDSKTCLGCHSREKVTFALGKRKGTLDVHTANGMGCVDCHKGHDVHGDGTPYRTMRDEGAVQASCGNCHELGDNIKAHTVHNNKLDCAACHVANTTSCLNCHFSKFLEQKKRPGNFFPPIQDWMILVNYKGKVTSGNVQTLVHEGKTFITYAPYFTHAVRKKARACPDCHGTKAVKRLKKGRKVVMAKYEKDEMVSFKGVVPLVPDLLVWQFMDKEGDKWVPIKTKEKPMVQYSCYAEPFTKEQIKKMAKAAKN